MKNNSDFIFILIVGVLCLTLAVFVLVDLHLLGISFKTLLTDFIITFSLLLIIHGIFTLVWMLYAWENPEYIEKHKSPKQFIAPQFSFTALIPARHEENVIRDTIKAVDDIDYPKEKKEILVLCRQDDLKTVTQVNQTILETGNQNIKLVIVDSVLINKPSSLNQGLWLSNNQIIAVFDAEDEPHKDIYNIVNTILVNDKVDFVQSGVQLMNYRSNWFSTLNVLEYYFWFKSALHFFSNEGKIAPLGGNTVFFKKEWLKLIKGWDEKCLTEDADIGLRLISAGAKLKVVYDEQHVTKEETPPTLNGFIKQRTRWNQGFIQVLFKGDWTNLPGFKQKLFAAYILLSAEFQTILLLYIPFALWMVFTQKVSVVVSLFSFVPFFLLVLQVMIQIIGLYEFTKAYNLKFPFWMPFKILVTFYPYQIILMFSAFRAFYRTIFSVNGWEKTMHINAHRQIRPAILLTP